MYCPVRCEIIAHSGTLVRSSNMPPFPPAANALMSVMSAIDRLAPDKRSNLHGAFEHLDPDPTGVVTVQELLATLYNHDVTVVTWDHVQRLVEHLGPTPRGYVAQASRDICCCGCRQKCK